MTANKNYWTVGMAVYEDPKCPIEGVRAMLTVMNLLTYHPRVGEVVVVDNNPPTGEERDPKVLLLNNPLAAFLMKTRRTRYIPMPSPRGTAPPRNRVFTEARFDRVACVDPHVILYPEFFDSLDHFYADHGEDSKDLLHGPLMTEFDEVLATHMNDQWRAEMWGTWGRAWVKGDPRHRWSGDNSCARCGIGLAYQKRMHEVCPNAGEYLLFSVLTRDDRTLEYVSLDPDGEQKTLLNHTDYGLPDLPWPGHEVKLEALGCRPYLDAPFPIPGHGMGFFACRKDAWLPFHEDCRGFGGEEMTTGVRFRQAGRRCWCVPGARWWHHFHRPAGVPYRLITWDKVHNYVAEFRRLGLSLDSIYEEFVRGRPRERDWEAALAGFHWPPPNPAVSGLAPRPADVAPDPPHLRHGSALAVPAAPGGGQAGPGHAAARDALIARAGRPCGAGNQAPTPGNGRRVVDGLDGLYGVLAERDPARMAAVRELAARAGTVTEVGTLDGLLTTAALAGRPRAVTTYDTLPRSGRPQLLKALAPAGAAYLPLLSSEENLNPVPAGLLLVRAESAADAWDRIRRFESRAGQFLAVDAPGFAEEYSRVRAEYPRWASTLIAAPLVAFSTKENDFATFFPRPPATASPSGGTVGGPGTELKALLASLGINPSPSCSCNARAADMDRLGVAWCKENTATILGWLREGTEEWGWGEAFRTRLKAGVLGLFRGLAFKVNWADPMPGLVAEAVRRAGEKETGGPT
jgi:hypothetical protein